MGDCGRGGHTGPCGMSHQPKYLTWKKVQVLSKNVQTTSSGNQQVVTALHTGERRCPVCVCECVCARTRGPRAFILVQVEYRARGTRKRAAQHHPGGVGPEPTCVPPRAFQLLTSPPSLLLTPSSSTLNMQERGRKCTPAPQAQRKTRQLKIIWTRLLLRASGDFLQYL